MGAERSSAVNSRKRRSADSAPTEATRLAPRGMRSLSGITHMITQMYFSH